MWWQTVEPTYQLGGPRMMDLRWWWRIYSSGHWWQTEERTYQLGGPRMVDLLASEPKVERRKCKLMVTDLGWGHRVADLALSMGRSKVADLVTESKKVYRISCSRLVYFQFKGNLVEYKFNMDDVNTVLRRFNVWRYHELVKTIRVSILRLIGGCGRVSNSSGLVGSGQVWSQKIDPWISLIDIVRRTNIDLRHIVTREER